MTEQTEQIIPIPTGTLDPSDSDIPINARTMVEDLGYTVLGETVVHGRYISTAKGYEVRRLPERGEVVAFVAHKSVHRGDDKRIMHRFSLIPLSLAEIDEIRGAMLAFAEAARAAGEALSGMEQEGSEHGES